MEIGDPFMMRKCLLGVNNSEPSTSRPNGIARRAVRPAGREQPAAGAGNGA